MRIPCVRRESISREIERGFSHVEEIHDCVEVRIHLYNAYIPAHNDLLLSSPQVDGLWVSLDQTDEGYVRVQW